MAKQPLSSCDRDQEMQHALAKTGGPNWAASVDHWFDRFCRRVEGCERAAGGGQYRAARRADGRCAKHHRDPCYVQPPERNDSWSWVTVSDASFPKMTANPRFLGDQRTCVLPVSLESGKTYAMWLNQPPHENFQDQDGHKAVPYLLVFETRR
jgi:hypothetical protein